MEGADNNSCTVPWRNKALLKVVTSTAFVFLLRFCSSIRGQRWGLIILPACQVTTSRGKVQETENQFGLAKKIKIWNMFKLKETSEGFALRVFKTTSKLFFY